MALVESNNIRFYCEACERGFSTERALQQHVENSKIHKKEVKRQGKTLPRLPAFTLGTRPNALQHGANRYESRGQLEETKNQIAWSSTDLQL